HSTMSAIATKICKKYNLSSKTSVFELSQYISEFLKVIESKLDAQMLSGWRNRKNKTINIVTSKQITKKLKVETIEEIAYRILQDKRSISDVKAIAQALANSAPNANTSLLYFF
ncbi:6351_t:CDS:2, partial [Gigaspora rosea]